MSSGRIAILIDVGFLLKRLPKLVGSHRCDSPGKIVACLRRLCRRHIKTLTGDEGSRWHKHVDHQKNPKQIRNHADCLLGSAVMDVDGNREDRSDVVFVFNGPLPRMRVLKNVDFVEH